MKCWLKLLVTMLGLLQTIDLSQSCYSGIRDLQQRYPLPSNPDDVRYTLEKQQVILPGHTFSCLGYISSWSAHTLVLTRSQFVDVLTHVAVMQVWRPGSHGNKTYTKVGSNRLEFSGDTLRNGITSITGETEIAHFTFSYQVPPEQQILVQPGDVVGWYVPELRINPPLSPLFRDRVETDPDHVVTSMVTKNATQTECVFCSNAGDNEVVLETVPLVSATLSTPSLDDTCTTTDDQICNVSTTNTPQQTPTSGGETTPTAPSPTPTASEQGQLSATETVCIIVACVTLALHIVMVVLCAANFIVMRRLGDVLRERTVMPVTTPGIRSPSTPFGLGALTHRKAAVTTPVAGGGGGQFAPETSFSRHADSETPAPYEAVRSKYDTAEEMHPADPALEEEEGQGPVYEPIDEEQSRNRVLHSPALEDTDGGSRGGKGTHSPALEDTDGGSRGGKETGESSPSLSEQTPNNSRTGSRIDLLDTGSMKRSHI